MERSCPSSRRAAPTSTTSSRTPGSLAEHERRLPAAERERVLEAVERHAQADELLERARPPPPHLVQGVDAGEPVLTPRVHAAEEHPILEHGVDADRAPVEADRLLAPVDAEETHDAAPAHEPERVGHQLGVARALDDEVEAADIVVCGGDVARAGLLDQRPGPLERRRDHLDAVEAEQERDERPDRAGADHQRTFQLPRLAAADRPRMAKSARTCGGRLGENAQASERARDRHELLRAFPDELARVAVQLRDPALAVVPGEARVGRALAACKTVPARAANGRRDEVAAREAVAVALDDSQRLVAE